MSTEKSGESRRQKAAGGCSFVHSLLCVLWTNEGSNIYMLYMRNPVKSSGLTLRARQSQNVRCDFSFSRAFHLFLPNARFLFSLISSTRFIHPRVYESSPFLTTRYLTSFFCVSRSLSLSRNNKSWRFRHRRRSFYLDIKKKQINLTIPFYYTPQIFICTARLTEKIFIDIHNQVE